MLDRRIPFCNIIMRCDRILPMEIRLPEGYAIRAYQPGDEAAENVAGAKVHPDRIFLRALCHRAYVILRQTHAHLFPICFLRKRGPVHFHALSSTNRIRVLNILLFDKSRHSSFTGIQIP